MRLLLTSNGLSNASIAKSLENLVGKPPNQTKIGFIPTAAYGDLGNKDWLINDLYRIKELGYYVDIIELTALKGPRLAAALKDMDVIFVGGGNSFYLSYWMQKSGLLNLLPKLLKTKVYAGISAGTMAAGDNIRISSEVLEKFGQLRDEDYDEIGPPGESSSQTARLVSFAIRPHLNSPEFPKVREEILEKVARRMASPMYAIDNQTAIQVVDDKVKVVSEGKWKLYD